MSNMNKDEMLELFKGLLQDEQEADDIKKGVKEDLKSYAENNEINPKAVTAAFNLFKKYASGKQTAEEEGDFAALSNMVMDYFAAN